MKKFYPILILCLLSSLFAISAPKYWVGPQNGNWSDQANWSDSYNGSGGAAIPGAPDSVVFRDDVPGSSGYSLIHVDISPTISGIGIFKKVTLYASTLVVFRILKSFEVGLTGILKDSTSEDVSFNVVFNGATKANGVMSGQWIFEGGVAVNRLSGNGAGLLLEAGSRLNVSALKVPLPSGIMIFKNNTNYITSDASTLLFSAGSKYILDNNLNAAIPNATWSGIVWNGTESVQGTSSISIIGRMDKLKHLAPVPCYRDINVNLAGQVTDASLQLPDGTIIDGYLTILSTNNFTLTLLATTGTNSIVKVGITSTDAYSLHLLSGGDLKISANSKVAMAAATSAAPGTNYTLNVISYNQTGGNFSLQDFNDATGTSNLGVSGGLQQQNGTFITNSTTTSATAEFNVTMDGPYYYPRLARWIPSSISMSSGSIDNANHTVTLIVRQSIDAHLNVSLYTPLTVGKLRLMSGAITTTEKNILTVANPDPLTAITLINPNHSFINGPMRRQTNSVGSYMFPTGSTGNDYNNFVFDSCVIAPSSSEPSLYQAELFSKAFSDLGVIAPLKGVSNNRYWNISRVSGSDAKMQLFVHAPVPGVASSDALVVSNYVNGHWVTQNGSVLTPGNSSTGSVVSKQLSSFGSFTFGFADPVNLPPDTIANPPNGLKYKYYEGAFSTLPDFSSLIPVKTGKSPNVDIGVRRFGVNDSFAIVWEGYITITTPGTYTFETVSDDGSKLYFNSLYAANGIALVNNDGTHPQQPASGTVNIPLAGKYPIAITYFQNYGDEGMQVYWTGPGIQRQTIPDLAFGSGSPLTTSGLNYKYYEGAYSKLPDFNALTPVKTGNSTNIDLGIRRPGINDGFAIMWEGYINIPTPGTYTFETISDDGSKLYFNSSYSPNEISLVNNDGIHSFQSAAGTINIPAAGRYPVTFTFFENAGAEGMQVFWTGPGIERQLIPDAAFMLNIVSTTNGLNYKYYEGDFNALPDFDSLLPVMNGNSKNADIGVRPAGVNDRFAFIWEGYINMPIPGNYIFETVSDDGSKIYFNKPYSANGSSLVNNDGLHAPGSSTGNILIPEAGRYPISITYFQKDGGETMQVYWTVPGFSRQLIPDDAFGAEVPPNTCGLNYKYYEGDFDSLPNFNSLTPVKTGVSLNTDIVQRPGNINDHFAFLWEGYINIPVTGTYTFETVSDDGSKLYFNSFYSQNSVALVMNDGLHASVPATGTVTISSGIYPIAITYFEKNGSEAMQLYWTGPGIDRKLIPNAAFCGVTPVLTHSNAVRLQGILPGSGALIKSAQDSIAIKNFYPNPFTESVNIDFYSTSVRNKVSVDILNLGGRLLFTYQAVNPPAGNNTLKINLKGRSLANGVYLVRFNINGILTKTAKLIKVQG